LAAGGLQPHRTRCLDGHQILASGSLSELQAWHRGLPVERHAGRQRYSELMRRVNQAIAAGW